MTAAVRTADEIGLEVRLFGGPEFSGPLGVTSLVGSKQRAVAGRLAIDAGRAVSVDQLLDAIWGDNPPPTVRASLQVHISQIRRTLAAVGLHDVIVTRPGGYLFDLAPDRVDLSRFEQMSSAAATAHGAGMDDRALDLAMAGFGLWRGPLLTGAGGAPFVDGLSERAEGARLRLVTVATASAIATNRVSETLAVVEPLGTERPYDEPLWESIARLLYANGRQVDALDRLATVRRVLRDELGLDPSPAIAELEHQILHHEPSLAVVVNGTARRMIGNSTTNLPPARLLVGRAVQVEEVTSALRRHRLVTLVGPGGIGKTALAAVVATMIGPDHADGVCFVDLTSIPPGHDALTAVVAALGMTPSADERAREEVVDLLKGRRQLLVLDNCEHVLASAAVLTESLAACPGLVLLVTSREPIDLDDEVIIDVPPLSTADGVELFVRRSQSTAAGFVPDAGDLDAIRRIVELVDGVPLALELASPLIRSLSPKDIVDEMARGTSLSIGRRGTVGRHASMDQTVRWSHDLLDLDEKLVFEVMSVFAGRTDLNGVVDVCAAVTEVGLSRADIIEVLGRLVNRSLVTVERTATAMSYGMLAPIRAFASSQLEQSGLGPVTSRAHVHHVIELLRRATQAVEGADPAPGLAATANAAPDIRSAHLWCSQHDEHVLAAELVSSFSIFSFYEMPSVPELLGWARAALSTPEVPASTRLRLMLAVALNFDGQPGEMMSCSSQALQLAEASNDRRSWVIATVACAHAVGDFDNAGAMQQLRRAMEVAVDLGDPVLEGLVIHYLSNHLLRAEARGEVADLLDRRMAFGTTRFGLFEPEVLYQRGRTAFQDGDLTLAVQFYRRAREAASRIGSLPGRASAVFGLGAVEFERGALEESLELFMEGLELDRLVEPRELWGDYLWVGIVAARLGRRGLVEAQLRAIEGSQRPLVLGAEALLAGCVAHLNGIDDVSAEQFDLAVHRFAGMNVRTHLRTAVLEWARCTHDETMAAGFIGVADELRGARITPDEAISLIDRLVADR